MRIFLFCGYRIPLKKGDYDLLHGGRAREVGEIILSICPALGKNWPEEGERDLFASIIVSMPRHHVLG